MTGVRAGHCHLCGSLGKLSFEHVPPESAFNDRKIVTMAFDDLVTLEDLDQPKGRFQQRGAGAYTLCEKCNNDAGRWYVPAYADWAAQAMGLLLASRGRMSLVHLYQIFPLRVLKQICCMFFSVNGPSFQQANTDLVRFVLNKDSMDFPNRLKIYAFYSISEKSRSSGMTGLLRGVGLQTRTLIFSEIVFPPFGFVLCPRESDPPSGHLCDITHFSRYSFRHWHDMVQLKMPVMPIYTWFPGDYRTRDQTLEDLKKNTALMKTEREPHEASKKI